MNIPDGCISRALKAKATKSTPPLAVTFMVPVQVVSEANMREILFQG